MWTRDTRAEHDRDDLRYHLTDAEWQVLAPLFPPPATTGRRRAWPMREQINAMFFMLRGGILWRLLPTHFPPHQTVSRWFTRFRDDGTWESLNHHLVMLDRESAGREASPSTRVIDRQSVKTTAAGGPRGYDAGKKIKGRKRHALVDTDGRGLELQVHPACVQDRNGVPPVLQASRPASLSSRPCLPTVSTPVSGSPRRPQSPSRSCGDCPIRWASKCCRAVGWSNASSPGSTATAGSRRTSRDRSLRPTPSSTPPASCC